MAKPMVCQTVICKVNGTTLLKLNNSATQITIAAEEEEEEHMIAEPNHEDYEEQNIANSANAGYDEEPQEDDSDGEYETTGESNGNVFEMETVDTSIESVRQYVATTRRNGKVWHQCRWTDKNSSGSKTKCTYGSKWSGAMVNHIRSHLGIKPFRCPFCDKLFTIACNLKNHLRIHHGLKTKIVLNGGRRMKGSPQMLNNDSEVQLESEEEAEKEENDQAINEEDVEGSKFRVFKPSFVNGKANNAYAPTKRVLPKRNVKKSKKYIDFEEDFDDEDLEDDKDDELEMEVEQEVNEEEAEEENRRFYEKTVEDEDVLPEPEAEVSPRPEAEGHDEEENSQYVTRRQYNKVLWWVCLWSPRLCKYRSHEKQDVLNHVTKHQNLNKFICNECGLTFANRQVLDSHLLSHAKHKFLKCNLANCSFQTINDSAMKVHKLKHKRHKN